ncbi:MAG: SAM-dependent methyltransferase, partial [Marinoscillum sp.]
MIDEVRRNLPKLLQTLEAQCSEIGFTMPSDRKAGALIRTLVASKPGGRFLELGTGVGLSLVWMLDGLDHASRIVSIDNDPELVAVVQSIIRDQRLTILCE